MKRIAAAAVACVLLAGCGGSHHLISGHPQHHAEVAKLAHGFAPRTSLAGVPTVEQFDSVTVSTVPSWAHYAAGYVNGNWPTYWRMRGHWPVVVGISVTRSGGADCLDMEPGNPGTDAAGPWVKWQWTQGNARPCLYTMLSWMGAVRANLAAYGIPRSRVRLWDANWTYGRHLDAGYDCTQWTDHAYNLNLDESTCAASFYGTSKPPPPPPPPAHYDWFPVSPPVADGKTERLTVEQYDGARAHPAKYAAYLRNVLEPELRFDARRVAYLALNVWHSWNPNRGGWRFQQLIHRGQRKG